MTVHDIDPQPILNPKDLTADGLLAFEFAMEQWFDRRRMSWGNIVDYRSGDRQRRIVSAFHKGAKEMTWKDTYDHITNVARQNRNTSVAAPVLLADLVARGMVTQRGEPFKPHAHRGIYSAIGGAWRWNVSEGRQDDADAVQEVFTMPNGKRAWE
jgi:hypothetical protein